MITLFVLVSLTRPEPLRPLWTLTDAEVDSLVPPITRWVNRLEQKYVRQISAYADPAMAAAALLGIIIPRIEAEQRFWREVKASRGHGGAAVPAGGSGQGEGAAAGNGTSGGWASRVGRGVSPADAYNQRFN